MANILEALSTWESENRETIASLEKDKRTAIDSALNFFKRKYGDTSIQEIFPKEEEVIVVEESDEGFDFDDNDFDFSDVDFSDFEFDLKGDIEEDDLDISDIDF